MKWHAHTSYMEHYSKLSVICAQRTKIRHQTNACQEKQLFKRLLYQVLKQPITATCNNSITDGKVHRNVLSSLLGYVLNHLCSFPPSILDT